MQSFSMSFQITFQSETLTTMTVEIFLTSVQSHVSLQTDLPSECLPTDRTHKALSTPLYHKIIVITNYNLYITEKFSEKMSEQ